MGELVKAALRAQMRLALARGEEPEGTDTATLFVAKLDLGMINREGGSCSVIRRAAPKSK